MNHEDQHLQEDQKVEGQKVHVSITGLKLRRFWHAPRFWHHAFASMAQAKAAPGCLAAEARTIDGIHHTRSVWASKEDMRVFLRSGAHLRAMKAFSAIATGKTYGFDTRHVPDWPTTQALWRDKGRSV